MKEFLRKYKFVVLYFLSVPFIFFVKEMEFNGLSKVCRLCWSLDINLCNNFIGYSCYSYFRFYLPLPIYYVGYFPHYKGLLFENIITDLFILIFLFVIFYIGKNKKLKSKMWTK